MIENTFGMNIIPGNDAERLKTLYRYRILDTPSEASFDNIARLCTQIFNVPISLVSLVDAERVFFKANVGMGRATEANRGKSLCALAVLDPEVTVFEDALKEPCLMANPNVAGDFGLRFYAGAPLVSHDGFLIGTLCIIDKQPRSFTKAEQQILAGMATAIMDQVELRLSALEEIDHYQSANTVISSQQQKLQEINEELTASNEELRVSQEEMISINHQLVISENRFRKLMREVPVAIATYTGREMIIEQANEEMLRLWGKTDKIIDLPLLTARPEMEGHPYLEVLQEVFSTGKTHIGYNIKGPVFIEGQLNEGYFDATYKAVLNDQGEITGVMVVAIDVTEKRLGILREQELLEELTVTNEELMASNEELAVSQEHLVTVNHHLSENESRFRKLIKESPNAIAILRGPELIIDGANNKILAIWGKDISVIGKPLLLALPELKGQPFPDLLARVYATGEPYYGNEAKISMLHDGVLTDMYVNFTYQPIGQAGEFKDIMIVANEVTEQVLARQSVDEINQRLQIALDASKLGSTEVDLATGIMQSTDQFKANYGYQPHETFNYPDLFNAMLPEYRETVKALVQTAMDKNEVYTAEYPVTWPDGSVHWISAHGRPRFDENGKPRSMVGMTADITETRLFQQRKDDFLSIASHELKTPITSLKASLQLLDRIKDKPFAPLHTKLIEQSNRSMEKMSVLVDDLLNMNRMAEGQLHLKKTTFNISDMLQQCCNHVRVEDQYDLIIEGDKDLEIRADEHRIDQVVVNFVNNAVKYAPDSRKIFLIIEKEGDYARISVKDNGPGIPEHIMPHLFDRFYRVNHDGQTYTGLGLGLYICSEIIKKHDGKIGVESELGKGSTFWFTIPLQ